MSHELREIEIRETPRLSPEQAGILDLHSVLNVLNVLACELQLLGIALENDSEVLSSSLAFCERLASALSRPGEALALVATTDDGAREVLSEVDALIGRHPEQAGRVAVVNGRASIGSVLEVFCVRAKEILARAEHPLEWRAYEPEGLRSGLVQVLRAIESHARGRLGFVFDGCRRKPVDYVVELGFDPGAEERIWMPPVLVDVMRDLLANARKYTEPGGRLALELLQTGAELRLTVHDSGMGIPEDELSKVVQFGHRARNALHIRTMGGGFGLTKAHWVTRQFGGRFWLASRVGVGTRVRIALPRPRVRRSPQGW